METIADAVSHALDADDPVEALVAAARHHLRDGVPRAEVVGALLAVRDEDPVVIDEVVYRLGGAPGSAR
jgi:hypothetical protein